MGTEWTCHTEPATVPSPSPPNQGPRRSTLSLQPHTTTARPQTSGQGMRGPWGLLTIGGGSEEQEQQQQQQGLLQPRVAPEGRGLWMHPAAVGWGPVGHPLAGGCGLPMLPPPRGPAHLDKGTRASWGARPARRCQAAPTQEKSHPTNRTGEGGTGLREDPSRAVPSAPKAALRRKTPCVWAKRCSGSGATPSLHISSL